MDYAKPLSEKMQKYIKMMACTLLSLFVSDIDFTSVYPSVMRGANIARDTFVSALFKLGHEGEVDVQDIVSRSLNSRENTVSICSEHLGLPNYMQFDKLLKRKLKGDK